MLASTQCNSSWRTWQPGLSPVVVRGSRVRARAASGPAPQAGGPLELANKTYARLLRKYELDVPLAFSNVIDCPEVTLGPTWQLPGLYVDSRSRPLSGGPETGLRILQHLQRHACYPPPPSQDAAAEGLPVPGSQEWAQLMAATGREASILACSLQQPCRVCQQLHITPSELQLAGNSSTTADDSASTQLSSSTWAAAVHDPVVDLGLFLKAADGSWLMAVPVLQNAAGRDSSSSRSSSSNSRAADAAMQVLRKAAAQTTAAQCPVVVGTHLLVPLAELCSSVAVQAVIAAACEKQLASMQQQGEDAGTTTTTSSSSDEEEPGASTTTPSTTTSSSSGPVLHASTSTRPDAASSAPHMYSVEPPKLCLHVQLRPGDYQRLAGSKAVASTWKRSSNNSSGAASKQQPGTGGGVRLDSLRWAVKLGQSRRRQLDSLFALGRSGLQGLIVAADDHLNQGLQWLLESVTNDRLVSLDMEWPAHYMAGPNEKVALIQLASPTRCLLVRMRHQRVLPDPLRRFLRRPDITVLAQSWNSSDAVMMADMGMSGEKEFTRLLDLQPLSEAMGYCKPGLGGMVQALLYPGFMKNKRVTRSKWDAQRLSEAQVRYAILDGITVQHVFRTLLQQHRSNYTLATQPALSGPVFTRTASSLNQLQFAPPAPSQQVQVQQQQGASQQQQQSGTSSGAGQQEAGSACACPECGLPYGAMVVAPTLLVCSQGGCVAIPTRSCTSYEQHCARSGHWQHTRRWECGSCRRFVYEHQWEASQEQLAALSLPADGLQLQEVAVIQG